MYMSENTFIDTYKGDLILSLKEEDYIEFKKIFKELHPYEQSVFYEELEGELRHRVYKTLSPYEISIFFWYLDSELIRKEFEHMHPQYVAKIFENLSIDDAVQIFNELDNEEMKSSFLNLMDKQIAVEIKSALF